MKQILSVWLVPTKSETEELSEIIEDLARENNSPVFIPHLTLINDVFIKLDDLKRAVNKAFSNQKQFRLNVTKVSQSELFFKTVFIEFEISRVLENLFLEMSSTTNKASIDSFKPHISLIYKKMPKDRKEEIIKKVKIRSEYLFSSVYINAPRENEKDFRDISGWRSLYIKKLDN